MNNKHLNRSFGITLLGLVGCYFIYYLFNLIEFFEYLEIEELEYFLFSNIALLLLGGALIGVGLLVPAVRRGMIPAGLFILTISELLYYFYLQAANESLIDREDVTFFLLWLEIIVFLWLAVLILANLRKPLLGTIPILALIGCTTFCFTLWPVYEMVVDEGSSSIFSSMLFSGNIMYINHSTFIYFSFHNAVLCFAILFGLLSFMTGFKKEATPAAVAQAEAQPIAPPVALSADPAQRIAQLDQLYMTGQIDEQEYLRQKAALRNQPV